MSCPYYKIISITEKSIAYILFIVKCNGPLPLIVWGHGIQVERLLFFKEEIWEEVKALYGLWKEKFFIRSEGDYEEDVDVDNEKESVLYGNNGRIYDSYRATNISLRDYGIKWRMVNEYYRLWNEYQEDSFKINKRKASLLFRDVIL
jgi:hypothetical protein